LPLLVTLVNKSWLYYDREKDRFNIHELLRQFGAEKLSLDKNHEQKIQDRHSVYFCGFLNERIEAWSGPRQLEVALELQFEIENIQTAWRRSSKVGDKTLLAQGLSCLCRFYIWEGRTTDGRITCRLAADGLSNQKVDQQVDDPERLALLSQVLAWESKFVNEGAKREELLLHSQEVLDRVAQTGRDTRPEQAFIYLAKASAVGIKDFEESLKLGAQARDLFHKLDDHSSEAEVLNLMGNRYIFQGAFDEASESLRESLEIRQQLEDTNGIGDTTINLALVYQHQGKYEEAETLHLQGLKLYRQLQNRFLESRGLTVLSFTHSWAGNFFAARESAEQSLEIRRDLGGVPYLWNLIALTNAGIHLGRYDETKARAIEILELAQQRGHSTEKGYALMYLGNIAFVEGDYPRAMVHLEESSRLMAGLKYVYQGLPRSNLCYVVRARGDGKSAHHHLESALRSGIRIHSVTPIMYCLPVAALLAADDRRFERAIELYTLAQRFGHITNSRWFREVACQELDDLRATLPPEVIAAAEERGRELNVWETANDLLEECTTIMSH
jgi:tetratricopeptide (TPR) repeat protein